ncbi:MAG: helix-turn-helix domain-containing protein [Candidatus Sulfotelmatobacter sp.]
MSLEELVLSRKSAMTVEEVALLLNVSERLVYQLVSAGEIPHFRVGSAVRFEPKSLSTWLHEKLTQSRNKRAVKAIERIPRVRARARLAEGRAKEQSPQTGAPGKVASDAAWSAVLLGKPWRA